MEHKIKIDDKEVSFYSGQTVLEAALDAGIYIPHLCAHPDLTPIGECKLCVVEMDGRLVQACKTLAESGMSIVTKNDAIDHCRVVAMELMLAGHPHDCTSCKAYLKCELQALMQYTGAVHARLHTVKKTATSINNKNPLIVRELERCIQCGRCVRVCEEKRGVGVLHYKKVGREIYIGTEDNKPLLDAGCRFCGACVEVCPTGALQDAEGVFREDLPREQALVPCQAECPAHIDIPAYIRAIAHGDYSQAVGIIREKVPFPHSLGYVCNHVCETGCKHKALDLPVSIRELKRFAVEHDKIQQWKARYLQAGDRTGKTVAVVGAGACGLTAAYYLNKKGHAVTVFEEKKIPGGQMTSGIPEYRIPQADVLEEIQLIIDSGVQIKCNTPIESAKDLKNDYDAVLVAIGTSVGKKLTHLPGADCQRVYSALEVLQAQRLESPVDLGDTVSVIGGGNVAFDVARTMVRQGKTVNIICLEKDASQASKEERDLAVEEGVRIFDRCSTEKIIVRKGQVAGVQVHKINDFYFEPNTHELIEDAVPQSTCIISCDAVVFAAGQVTGLTEAFGLQLNHQGYPINPETGKSEYITSIEGVFAAGDVITGTKHLIDAIASAREVTQMIDRYLGGTGEIEEELVEREKSGAIGNAENLISVQRGEMAYIAPQKRMTSFELETEGFTQEQAVNESGRCLQCDLRLDLKRVKMWTEYTLK